MLLLSRHPLWQKDLRKEGGLGPRYSFMEYEKVEARVRGLVEEGKADEADLLMEVVECLGFEGWGKAKTLRKWVRREVRGAARTSGRGGEEGVWKVFRPVDGSGPGVLVRSVW